MKKCSCALIGISGFGLTHLNLAEELEKEGVLDLTAVCEINYEKNSERIDALVKRGVRYYRDYRLMLETEKGMDFVAIATPLGLHRKMAVDVMEAGFHVLLEKPPAVTIQDIDAIIVTSERTNKLCAIDFMMTSMKGFLELKGLIWEGRLGNIGKITGRGLWKRLDSYYARTPWAGRLVTGDTYTLDGSVTNPLSHVLNNMLQLSRAAGGEKVAAVTAELYHAHSIEGEDTACIGIEMDNGLGLNFYTTLCNPVQYESSITVEGTLGKASLSSANILETEISGEKKVFDFGSEELIGNMYKNLCAVITGQEKELRCSAAGTRNFVLVANGAFESSGAIHAVPSAYTRRYPEKESMATDIVDIESIIDRAAKEKKLFSDLSVPWAVRGTRKTMEGYKEFNMFR